MQIQKVSNNFYKSKTLYYQNNMVAFKGIDEKTIDTFSEEEKEIIKQIKDIPDEIAKRYNDLRSKVSGLFKKGKIRNYNDQERAELNRFLKDQYMIEEAEQKVINEKREKILILQNNNETSIENIKLKKLNAQRAMQIRYCEQARLNKDSLQGFSSIGGYEPEKAVLKDLFIRKVALESEGYPQQIPNGILFFGPTSCGKTSFAKAFATEANCLFERVGSHSKRGESDEEFALRFWKDLQKKATTAEDIFQTEGTRTILLIDDLDLIWKEDSPISANLKEFLQSCSEDYHVTVFVTTNNPLSIPSPLRNNRRMEIKVSIDPPGKRDIVEILKMYLIPVKNNNIDYTKLADAIINKCNNNAFAGAQIEDLCNRALSTYGESLSTSHLLEEIKNIEPGISSDELKKFKDEQKILNIIGGQ